MAGESIGTAYLALSVDISEYEARISKAEGIAAGFSKDVQESFQKLASGPKEAAASLIKYTQMIGKSADEVRLLRAEWRGVDAITLVGMATQINKVRFETEASIIATKDLEQSWAAMQTRAKAAQKDLLQTAAKEAIEDQARAVRQLAEQERALTAQRGQAISGQVAVQDSQRAAFANEQRLLTMRENATAAFGPLLQKQELMNVAAERESGIRDRLSAFLNTERGQRIAAAAANDRQAESLKRVGDAAQATGIQFNQYGLSVKQTQAALRQVPAQLTDIFVGLQGGQNPLTVLIQQGGQLKDVFGGIKPAAAALGNALLALITPWTLLAAAVVATVAAINDYEKRQAALSNALILTGNTAATTSEELRGYAKAIDETTTASERSAQRVVAQVAATGLFVSSQIEDVARAAVLMEESTGRAFSKTIADFSAMATGGADAIMRLNAAAGDGTNVVNFLTEANVAAIQSFREQGNQAAAAQVGIEAYFAAIINRAPQAEENLSNISKAMKDVRSNTGDAMDFAIEKLNSLLGVLGQVDQANIRAQKGIVDRMDAMGGMFRTAAAGLRDAIPYLSGQALPGQKSSARTTSARGTAPDVVAGVELQRRTDAQKLYAALVKSDLTDIQRQEEKITQIKLQGLAAGKDQSVIDADVAASRAKFAADQAKKNNGRSGRSLANAESKADLQAFKDQLLEEQSAIENGGRILEAQYSARLITVDAYYAALRNYAIKGQAAEETALTGQIAALKGRTTTGKDSIDVLRQIGELEAKLAKVRADGATQVTVLDIKESDFNAKRLQSITDYGNRLDESNLSLREATNAAIARIGMGAQEADQQEKINAALSEQARILRDLANARDNKDIDQNEYERRVALQQKATDETVRIITNGYNQMLAAQGDWLNGVKSGVADWIAQTADVASQIATITQNAFNRIGDGLAEFALTGKLNFKKMLADILSELVKFFAKQAVLKFIQFFASMAVGGASPSVGAPANGFVFPNANGNSFAGGTTLPLNSVVNKPTLFKFAKGGQFGVAGEAGAEAIMPLERGPGGKLGVKMYGGGGAQLSVNVVTNITSDGSANTNTETQGDRNAAVERFADNMRQIAQTELRRSMSPGGDLWKAGVAAR